MLRGKEDLCPLARLIKPTGKILYYVVKLCGKKMCKGLLALN